MNGKSASAQGVACDYCGRPAELTGGDTIYPHRPDLYEKRFYQCTPCAAYVGCHPGTSVPLGRLANASLRRAKSAAHAAFDPIWRTQRRMSRSQAYAWLAQRLGVLPAECHIGMFDEAMCARVGDVCQTAEVA